MIPARQGLLALSPVVVFLIFYVAVSVVIGDFYKMPIAVALLIASVWAILIYRQRPLLERIEIFSKAAGHSNILYMIWIFILAGAFATLAKELGAVDATVSLALRIFPPQFVIPMLFFAACFISLSVGTSVGTVVALTPLAVEIARLSSPDSIPFYVAIILGGAFFGDNLSFISDTTIAATRSQGCSMSDKFRANLWIALPAAIATLIAYMIIGHTAPAIRIPPSSTPWMVLPYLIVLITAIAGINVTIVLLLGILSAILTGILYGHSLIDMAGFAGAGIDSMGELIIVTLLAAGMLGIIKAAGGIQYLLEAMSQRIHGPRGAQGLIAILVSLVNLCTANNTIAIITVGGIARDIAKRYGIDPRKSASLLDSASCVVQCLIPYGAQALLAAGLAGISPAAPIPYLYYPLALTLMIILSIIFLFPRRLNRRPNRQAQDSNSVFTEANMYGGSQNR